jgi:hypothetical protein
MFPITIDFDNSETFLEIAFCFPYKHSEMLADIQQMESDFGNDDTIYFYRELLTKSYEGFEIPLLTITSLHLKISEKENYETINGPSKCNKFAPQKPVI